MLPFGGWRDSVVQTDPPLHIRASPRVHARPSRSSSFVDGAESTGDTLSWVLAPGSVQPHSQACGGQRCGADPQGTGLASGEGLVWERRRACGKGRLPLAFTVRHSPSSIPSAWSSFPGIQEAHSGTWLRKGRCCEWVWAFVGFHVVHSVSCAPGLGAQYVFDGPFHPAGKATRVGGEPGITRAVMSRIQVGASRGCRAPGSVCTDPSLSTVLRAGHRVGPHASPTDGRGDRHLGGAEPGGGAALLFHTLSPRERKMGCWGRRLSLFSVWGGTEFRGEAGSWRERRGRPGPGPPVRGSLSGRLAACCAHRCVSGRQCSCWTHPGCWLLGSEAWRQA